MNSKYDYKALLPFCKTDRQKEVFTSLIKTDNQRLTAKECDCSLDNVKRMIRTVGAYAATKGAHDHYINPQVLPDHLMVKGTSTLEHAEKGTLLQWVKTNPDMQKLNEALVQAVEALKEDLPKYKRIAKPSQGQKHLLNTYVVTDFHLGMLAWGEETGADWDVEIAENLLYNWFDAAVIQSPKADTAVLAQLGDFLHWDGMEAVTPSSGHVLDADSRFQKLVRIAVRMIRHIIDLLLKTHKHVHVIMATGNHDLASSVWLREMVAHVYQDEPRLTVDLSPDVYYCYEFEQVSLFFHHGHKRKPSNISDTLVAKFRKVLGNTHFSYAHLGHLHSHESKENGIMVIEQHRTLAAPDAYSATGGWMSGRDAQVITYHKQYGEVSRLRISPEMVQ